MWVVVLSSKIHLLIFFSVLLTFRIKSEFYSLYFFQWRSVCLTLLCLACGADRYPPLRLLRYDDDMSKAFRNGLRWRRFGLLERGPPYSPGLLVAYKLKCIPLVQPGESERVETVCALKVNEPPTPCFCSLCPRSSKSGEWHIGFSLSSFVVVVVPLPFFLQITPITVSFCWLESE